MSQANINNITPTISLSTAQTVPLLLASVALEELSLAHLMNAEAEKLQFVLGTLRTPGREFSPAAVSLTNLLNLDSSVQRTIRDVIKKEMLLEFKFGNILDLIGTLCSIQMTATEVNPCLFNIPGTVTCSGEVVPFPVTIDFELFINGVLAAQATFTFASGAFEVSVFFGTGTTGTATVTATTTVNGQTVSTAVSFNVNCTGSGAAPGSGGGFLAIEPPV